MSEQPSTKPASLEELERAREGLSSAVEKARRELELVEAQILAVRLGVRAKPPENN